MAGDWTSYGNARYNYWIDVPGDFSAIEESANGDGGTARSPDGNAKLAVWSVAYKRQKSNWAVWSGSKGDRVYYERAIPVCNDAVAYFRLEYDKAQAKTFDPIVTQLVKSLRSGDC
ncbi:hypothetical protein CYK37_01590 [Mesorhizobium loti]|nr:hypothetical protein CYK37_01590 [Mesorhizobium loti]